MEVFNKWSGSAHNVGNGLKRRITSLYLPYNSQDARLSGGYENVPTDDIHMRQVDFNDHWMYFLQEFIQPIQRKLYTGYFNSVSDRWKHSVATLPHVFAVASESGTELCCSLHAGKAVQASTSSRCLDLHDQSRIERHWQRLRGAYTTGSIDGGNHIFVGRWLSVSPLQLQHGFDTSWLGIDPSGPSHASTRRSTGHQRQTIHHGFLHRSLENEKFSSSVI